MNEIINKFLLAGDKFMPAMHHLLKAKKKIKEIQRNRRLKTFLSKRIRQGLLSTYSSACGDFKDLPERATSDKVLHDKIFDIAKIQKHDGYQHGLATKVHQFFDAKSYAANTFGGVLKMQQCYLPPLDLDT